MNKISNSMIINIITKLLVLLIIAKVISLTTLFYLPTEGIELTIKENYQPKYQRVDFKNMLSTHKVTQANRLNQTHSETNLNKEAENINDMILKGIYGNKMKAFVIIAMKTKPKNTDIISLGDVYHGYTLKEVALKNIIFSKNNKNYILYLNNIQKNNNSYIKKVTNNTNSKQNSTRKIHREDMQYYANNTDEIWKDISITEVKDGTVLKGFKITKINQKSIFAKLGLKKNDLIISANNIKLNSYRDVVKIYNNINTLDTIQIIVLRKNQEMEIVYEIN